MFISCQDSKLQTLRIRKNYVKDLGLVTELPSHNKVSNMLKNLIYVFCVQD